MCARRTAKKSAAPVAKVTAKATGRGRKRAAEEITPDPEEEEVAKPAAAVEAKGTSLAALLTVAFPKKEKKAGDFVVFPFIGPRLLRRGYFCVNLIVECCLRLVKEIWTLKLTVES